MNIIETKLPGVVILENNILVDKRGYFYESFNQRKLEKAIGQSISFVQDNQSMSTKGVLRGLHFQTGLSAQSKLIRAIQGEVLDVIVDMNKESETYGQYISILLKDNDKQVFVPRGYAHGFVVKSEQAIFAYKCDNFYDPDAEGGLKFDDPAIGIDWGFGMDELNVSDKDMQWPLLKDLK